MTHVVIPIGDGYISHDNVDADSMNLPDDAEFYEDDDEFKDRLSELEE